MPSWRKMDRTCHSRIHLACVAHDIAVCVNYVLQSGGRPLRVFYAFDPRRVAILLIGGDKTGDNRFYETYLPIADRLYDEHVQELRREGLI